MPSGTAITDDSRKPKTISRMLSPMLSRMPLPPVCFGVFEKARTKAIATSCGAGR